MLCIVKDKFAIILGVQTIYVDSGYNVCNGSLYHFYIIWFIKTVENRPHSSWMGVFTTKLQYFKKLTLYRRGGWLAHRFSFQFNRSLIVKASAFWAALAVLLPIALQHLVGCLLQWSPVYAPLYTYTEIFWKVEIEEQRYIVHSISLIANLCSLFHYPKQLWHLSELQGGSLSVGECSYVIEWRSLQSLTQIPISVNPKFPLLNFLCLLLKEQLKQKVIYDRTKKVRLLQYCKWPTTQFIHPVFLIHFMSSNQ